MNNLELGLHAELLVAQHLEKQGFLVLERNYKKRYGEIDVIATKENMLIFVEVKTRTHDYFDMAELVTSSKQKKIIKTASIYLASNGHEDKYCRFDVALVHIASQKYDITYLADAFND